MPVTRRTFPTWEEKKWPIFRGVEVKEDGIIKLVCVPVLSLPVGDKLEDHAKSAHKPVFSIHMIVPNTTQSPESKYNTENVVVYTGDAVNIGDMYDCILDKDDALLTFTPGMILYPQDDFFKMKLTAGNLARYHSVGHSTFFSVMKVSENFLHFDEDCAVETPKIGDTGKIVRKRKRQSKSNATKKKKTRSSSLTSTEQAQDLPECPEFTNCEENEEQICTIESVCSLTGEPNELSNSKELTVPQCTGELVDSMAHLSNDTSKQIAQNIEEQSPEIHNILNSIRIISPSQEAVPEAESGMVHPPDRPAQPKAVKAPSSNPAIGIPPRFPSASLQTTTHMLDQTPNRPVTSYTLTSVNAPTTQANHQTTNQMLDQTPSRPVTSYTLTTSVNAPTPQTNLQTTNQMLDQTPSRPKRSCTLKTSVNIPIPQNQLTCLRLIPLNQPGRNLLQRPVHNSAMPLQMSTACTNVNHPVQYTTTPLVPRRRRTVRPCMSVRPMVLSNNDIMGANPSHSVQEKPSYIVKDTSPEVIPMTTSLNLSGAFPTSLGDPFNGFSAPSSVINTRVPHNTEPREQPAPGNVPQHERRARIQRLKAQLKQQLDLLDNL